MSDGEGKIVLAELPQDNYRILIKECYEFQSLEQEINLFEVSEGNSAVEYVWLHKPEQAFIRIELFSVQEKWECPVAEADVQVMNARNTNSITVKESSSRSGKYEALVDPDEYLIFIKKYQFVSQKRTLKAVSGQNVVKVVLQHGDHDPSQDIQQYIRTKTHQSVMLTKKPKYLKPPSAQNLHFHQIYEIGHLYFIDKLSAQPISGASVKIFEHTTNKIFSHTSLEDGSVKLFSSSLSMGKIVVEQPQYYTTEFEYGSGKHVDLRNNKQNTLDVIPRPAGRTVEFLLNSNLDLYIKTPDNQVRCENQTKYPNMSHLSLQPSFWHTRGVYTIFTTFSEPNPALELKVLMTDSIHTLKIATLDQINTVPTYWICGTFHNFTFNDFDISCSSEEFLNMPTLVQPIAYPLRYFQPPTEYFDSTIHQFYNNSTIMLQDGTFLQGGKKTMVLQHDIVGIIGSAIFLKNLTVMREQEEMELRVSNLDNMLRFDEDEPELFQGVAVLKAVCVEGDLLFACFENRCEVGIFKWPSCAGVGYFRENNSEVEFLVKGMISISQRGNGMDNLKLWQVDIINKPPPVRLVKSSRTRWRINCVESVNDELVIGMQQSIGVYNKKTLQLVSQILCENPTMIQIQDECMVTLNDQSVVCIYQNQQLVRSFSSPLKMYAHHPLPFRSSNHLFKDESNLFAITQQGYVAFWQNVIQQPQPQSQYLLDPIIPLQLGEVALVLQCDFTPTLVIMDYQGNSLDNLAKITTITDQYNVLFPSLEHPLRVGFSFDQLDRLAQYTIKLYYATPTKTTSYPEVCIQKLQKGYCYLGLLTESTFICHNSLHPSDSVIPANIFQLQYQILACTQLGPE